jgi:signal peptidase I
MMFRRSTRRRARRVPAAVRWATNTVSFVLLCASVLAAIVLVVIPYATGSQTYSVLTSSMAPGYPPGTFLVVTPTDFDELVSGDVVTYQIESGKPQVITHRIVGFTADQEGNRLLVTQGDNNAVADEAPVREVQVRGKLSYAIPYVGFVANALGRADRGIAVNVLAAVLIAYGIGTIGYGALRRRGGKAHDDARA